MVTASTSQSARAHRAHSRELWSDDYQQLAYSVLGVAANIANRFLLDCDNPASESGREFMTNRGIGLDEAREFEIGFLSSTVSFEKLCALYAEPSELEVISRQYAQGILLRTLLLRESDDGLYPRRGNVLVLPERSASGEVVNIFLRLLDSDAAKLHKFVSLKDFGKKSTSFGIDHSLHAISRHKTAIIVEGPFDYLSLIRGVNRDLRIVIAPVGCQIFLDLLEKCISSGCERIVLAFDGDVAGVDSTVRAIEGYRILLEERGVRLGWLRWSKGSDPDDLLRYVSGDLRAQILSGVILGRDFTIRNAKSKDGITCRYIANVDAGTVVAETCIDLDVDRVKIPLSKSRRRNHKRDFGVLRLRCRRNSFEASISEGRGVTIPAGPFQVLLDEGRFALLAIFIIALKTICKGIEAIKLNSLIQMTSLSQTTVIQALADNLLRPFFALEVDMQKMSVFVTPSEEMKKRNRQLFPGQSTVTGPEEDDDVPLI